MTKNDIENKIKEILATNVVDTEVKEIAHVEQILIAYMMGTINRPLTSNNFLDSENLERHIPPIFHSLIAKLAIIKGQSCKSEILKILTEYTEHTLRDFTNYYHPDGPQSVRSR